MNLTKYNSMQPSRSIFEDLFDNLFEDDFGMELGNRVKYTQPMVNILEEKDKFQLEFAVPGLQKEDINIEIEKDQLIISSEKEIEEKEEMNKYTKKEFYYGSFKKTFHLPDSVNREDISAEFKNGILIIDLNKKEEAIDKGPKHIEIK